MTKERNCKTFLFNVWVLFTCKVVHSKRRCGQQYVNSHIQSSWTRGGPSRANDYYRADSFVSPGKTVVNGNAADVYYRTQEREKEETNTKKTNKH